MIEEAKVSYKDPECACFQDPRGAAIQTSAIVKLVQAAGASIIEASSQLGLCKKTLPMVLELLVINIGTNIAVGGTAIDMGSDEALWETQRVLKGIEQRVLDRLEKYHEEAKMHPEIAAKYNAMRSDR